MAVEEDLEATSVERTSRRGRARPASGLVQHALWLLDEGRSPSEADAKRLVAEARDREAVLCAEAGVPGRASGMDLMRDAASAVTR